MGEVRFGTPLLLLIGLFEEGLEPRLANLTAGKGDYLPSWHFPNKDRKHLALFPGGGIFRLVAANSERGERGAHELVEHRLSLGLLSERLQKTFAREWRINDLARVHFECELFALRPPGLR